MVGLSVDCCHPPSSAHVLPIQCPYEWLFSSGGHIRFDGIFCMCLVAAALIKDKGYCVLTWRILKFSNCDHICYIIVMNRLQCSFSAPYLSSACASYTSDRHRYPSSLCLRLNNGLLSSSPCPSLTVVGVKYTLIIIN